MLPEVSILLRDNMGNAFFGPAKFKPIREGDSYVVRFSFHPKRRIEIKEATVVYPWGANIVPLLSKVVAYPGDKVKLDLAVWTGLIPENSQEADAYADYLREGSDMTPEEFEAKLDQIYRL